MFNWSLRNGSQNQDIERKAGHNGAYGCVAFDGDVVRDKPVSSCHGGQPTHHPAYLRDQLERHTVWDIESMVECSRTTKTRATIIAPRRDWKKLVSNCYSSQPRHGWIPTWVISWSVSGLRLIHKQLEHIGTHCNCIALVQHYNDYTTSFSDPEQLVGGGFACWLTWNNNNQSATKTSSSTTTITAKPIQ